MWFVHTVIAAMEQHNGSSISSSQLTEPCHGKHDELNGFKRMGQFLEQHRSSLLCPIWLISNNVLPNLNLDILTFGSLKTILNDS